MKTLKIILISNLLIYTNSIYSQSRCNVSEQFITWGFKTLPQPRKIDLVIIHSTYFANNKDSFNVDGVLSQFKKYGVSAHYLISRNGGIIRLVAEKNVSFHAGKSKLPNGRTNINTNSIGIEIITNEHNAPTSAQYEALICLLGDIKNRYTINYIGGHKDIALGRKTDPWNFDWNKIK